MSEDKVTVSRKKLVEVLHGVENALVEIRRLKEEMRCPR